MLRLNCFIRVPMEHRDQVLDAARRLTEASLLQDGCVAYDIFTSDTRPEVLLICETWSSHDTLRMHSESDVFVKEVDIMRALSEMKLETFEF